MESVKGLVGLVFFDALWQCWLLFFQSFLLSWAAQPSVLDGARKKWTSLKTSHRTREPIAQTQALIFPQGSSVGHEGLSWLWPVLSWKKGDVSRINCPSYPVQCIQSWHFFLQQYAGTSLVNPQHSTKSPSPIGVCQSQYSLGEDSRKLVRQHVVDVTLLPSVLPLPVSLSEGELWVQWKNIRVPGLKPHLCFLLVTSPLKR